MVGKDLIMATLLGSGGGSSGSGGGGSAGVSPKEVNFYDYDGTCVHAYTVAEAQALSELPAGPEHPGLVFQGWNWSLEGVKGLTRAMNIGAMYTTDDGTTRLYITLQEGRTSPMLGVGVNGTVTVDWGDGTEPDVLTGTSTSTTVWTPNHAYAAPGDYVIRLTVDGEMGFTGEWSATNAYASILRHSSGEDTRNIAYLNSLKHVEIGSDVTYMTCAFVYCRCLETFTMAKAPDIDNGYDFMGCVNLKAAVLPFGATEVNQCLVKDCTGLFTASLPESLVVIGVQAFNGCRCIREVTIPDSTENLQSNAISACNSITSVHISRSCKRLEPNALSLTSARWFDFTACTAVPRLTSTNIFTNIPDDCVFLIPSALYDEWIATTNWTTFADRCVAK